MSAAGGIIGFHRMPMSTGANARFAAATSGKTGCEIGP
jgi:hypothetical protein